MPAGPWLFEESRLGLAELRHDLASDVAGEVALLQFLLHRLPAFGHDETSLKRFSAQVFADVARAPSRTPGNPAGGLVAVHPWIADHVELVYLTVAQR